MSLCVSPLCPSRVPLKNLLNLMDTPHGVGRVGSAVTTIPLQDSNHCVMRDWTLLPFHSFLLSLMDVHLLELLHCFQTKHPEKKDSQKYPTLRPKRETQPGDANILPRPCVPVSDTGTRRPLGVSVLNRLSVLYLLHPSLHVVIL